MSQHDRTERLLNLLFALMASARPVPKSVLRDVIDAYRDSPSDDAFERMFERDKEELRSMGVPVLTVEGSDGAGGIEGYRVAPDDYALPAVDLTTDELAVIDLAARVWETASLGPAAQRAARKLEAMGSGALVEGPVGIETRIATAEPAFPALLDAVRTRRTATFDYRKPAVEAPERREVQPWGVASRQGHWYLVGFDARRSAARVFRLSRVVGTVTVTGQPGQYDVPEGVDAVAMIAASTAGQGDQTARIRVAEGRVHALRRRSSGDPGADVVEVTYSDDESFAAELVAFGPDAVVLEPASLRDAVVRRLRLAAGEGAA